MRKFRNKSIFLLSTFLLFGTIYVTTSCDSNEVTPQKFKVELGELDGAKVSLDKVEAKEGEKVTITIESLPENKVIDKISVGEGINIAKVSDKEYYFEMPKADVTLSITLKVNGYTVSFSKDENHPDTYVEVTDTNGNDKTLPFVAQSGESFYVFLFSSNDDPAYGVLSNGVNLEYAGAGTAYLLTISTEDVILSASYTTPITKAHKLIYELDNDHPDMQVTFMVGDLESGDFTPVTEATAGTHIYVQPYSETYVAKKAFINGQEIQEIDGFAGCFEFDMIDEDATLTLEY